MNSPIAIIQDSIGNVTSFKIYFYFYLVVFYNFYVRMCWLIIHAISINLITIILNTLHRSNKTRVGVQRILHN